jgi:tripartite-type tricarboxylate transporter receptor subunit TctC
LRLSDEVNSKWRQTMRCKIQPISIFFIMTLAIGFVGPGSEQAEAQNHSFEGKTITILRGGRPGGSGDMQARALIPFLEKYLPGHPKIIIENMPGAAGMKAVNHAYTKGKPDGLTVTAVGSGLATGPILGMRGV